MSFFIFADLNLSYSASFKKKHSGRSFLKLKEEIVLRKFLLILLSGESIFLMCLHVYVPRLPCNTENLYDA